MRSSYEHRAKRFIKQIFPYLMACAELEEYEEAILNFQMDHPYRKVSCDHGLTRVAYITSDYVVKIDYDPENVARFGGGEKEMEFYALAERDGFAYLFAKISRFDYKGRTFYIMPRIGGIDEDRWEDAWDHMTSEESEWCMNHELFDLHCKNYGFRNGHVCIIDYGAHDD